MAQKVTHIAQLCLDAFYQEFPTATSFFKKDHFVHYCILADAKIKQDEYNLQVQMNLRTRRYNAPVVLNPDSYFTATNLRVKDDRVVLPYPIMSFPGPGNTLSVTQVVPDGGGCGSLIPITQAQKWQACRDSDKSIVYWLPTANDTEGCSGIEFINKKSCGFETVTVTYVPSLTPKSTIQESRGWVILAMVTGLLKTLKEGVVVDKSNDGNPNVSLQTEINKHLMGGLQSR